MKIAIISDIHGNLEAFSTVLEYLGKNIDEVICLGDIVGYGPSPKECCDIIRERKIYSLCGNHDAACFEDELINYFNPYAKKAIIWTSLQLTNEYISFLKELPFEDVIHNFRIVHGAPGNPFEYIMTPSDARESFVSFGEDLCFVGHSHIMEYYEQKKEHSLVRQLPLKNQQEINIEDDKRYIINVGSVGQPRDGDPRAGYVIYDTDEKVIKAYRVEYRIDIVQKKMQLKGLPPILWERLEVGR